MPTKLTRTEQILLEVAAERFGVAVDAVQLPDPNGVRPQLGEWLVAQGHLTEGQLDEVLEDVFARLQRKADRLAPPRPKPVPKVPEAGSPAEMDALVDRLATLLDRLVSGAAATPAEVEPVARPRSHSARLNTDSGTLLAGASWRLGNREESREELETANTLVAPGSSTRAAAPRDDETLLERPRGDDPSTLIDIVVTEEEDAPTVGPRALVRGGEDDSTLLGEVIADEDDAPTLGPGGIGPGADEAAAIAERTRQA